MAQDLSEEALIVLYVNSVCMKLTGHSRSARGNDKSGFHRSDLSSGYKNMRKVTERKYNSSLGQE